MEPTLLKSFNISKGDLTCAVPFIPDRYIASGTNNGVVMLLPLQPDARLRRLVGHRAAITCMSLAGDPICLATGSEDTTVRFWRLIGQEDSCILLEPNDGKIESISIASEASHILIAAHNAPTLWDPLTQSQILTLKSVIHSYNSVNLNIESNTATATTPDGEVLIFDIRTGELNRQIDIFTPATCSSLSRDGRFLAVGSNSGSVFYCDVGTGFISLSGKPHASEINSIDVSPDGSWVITGGDDSSVMLLDTDHMETRFILNPHKERVISTAFSYDGRQFTTCGADHKVLFWSSPDPWKDSDQEEYSEPPQISTTTTSNMHEEEDDFKAPQPKKSPIPSEMPQSDILTTNTNPSIDQEEESCNQEEDNIISSNHNVEQRNESIITSNQVNEEPVFIQKIVDRNRDIPEIAKTKQAKQKQSIQPKIAIYDIKEIQPPREKSELEKAIEEASNQLQQLYSRTHVLIDHMQKIDNEITCLEANVSRSPRNASK